MGFVELITLTDAAATVVAVSLWNHENAVEVIRNHPTYNGFNDVCDPNIRRKIFEKIQALPLTIPAKQHILDCCIFIRYQIKEWIENYNFLTISNETIMSLYSWKPKFMLNCLETAKRVILHEKNVLNSFRMACINCIEDIIFKLWPTVSLYFKDDAHTLKETVEVQFWIKYLKRNVESLMKEGEYFRNRHRFYEIAFNVAISHNSIVFAEHFLKKLQTEEASTLVNNTLKNILETREYDNYKVIPFFMHYLSAAEHEYLICSYPERILSECLKYPLSGQFEKIINKNWSYLSKEEFFDITKVITMYMHSGLANNSFTNIFIELWKNCPPESKDCVIDKCIKSQFLLYLSLENTTYVIKSIIQSSTSDQIRQMLFSDCGIMFLDGLISRNRLGCLSVSLQEFSHLEERNIWIDKLISSYRDKSSHDALVPAFSKEHLERLISVLETEKNTIFPASV